MTVKNSILGIVLLVVGIIVGVTGNRMISDRSSPITMYVCPDGTVQDVGANACVTSEQKKEESPLFSADVLSGSAPLKVRFTSDKISTHDLFDEQFYVDFGDGTEQGRLKYVNVQGKDVASYSASESVVDHTYVSEGTYTVKLIQAASCRSLDECNVREKKTVRTLTVIVSSKSGQ